MNNIFKNIIKFIVNDLDTIQGIDLILSETTPITSSEGQVLLTIRDLFGDDVLETFLQWYKLDIIPFPLFCEQVLTRPHYLSEMVNKKELFEKYKGVLKDLRILKSNVYDYYDYIYRIFADQDKFEDLYSLYITNSTFYYGRTLNDFSFKVLCLFIYGLAFPLIKSKQHYIELLKKHNFKFAGSDLSGFLQALITLILRKHLVSNLNETQIKDLEKELNDMHDIFSNNIIFNE